MSQTLISTNPTHGVTLSVASTTIVSTETVSNTMGATGTLASSYKFNDGPGGAGGTGVFGSLSFGITLDNLGSITGGVGGTGGGGVQGQTPSPPPFVGNGGDGGSGGVGVALATFGTIVNSGTHADITGGHGGKGGAANVDFYAAGYGFYFPDPGLNGNGGTGGAGVSLNAGGLVSNVGTILGGTGGISPGNGSGDESGQGGIGVTLTNGGTVNDSGLIAGGIGGSYYLSQADGGTGGAGVVFVAGGTLDVTTTGSIEGGAGGAGSTNDATSGGAGGDGVVLGTGGTLINAGTITAGAGGAKGGGSSHAGTAGNAVAFMGAGELIVDPTAVFNGAVIAAAGAGDVLELSGVAGTLNGIGTQFTNFQDISFAAAAAWRITGDTAGFATGETIGGFGFGDTIVLDGFDANLADTTYVSGTGLELTDTLGTQATLDITGPYATSSFIVGEASGATTISVHCYGRGTRIETPEGDIAIEDLRIGDAVTTASGAVRPIIWIGTRRFDPRFVGRNPKLLPIRICRDALADGVPRRDLLVSPEHAMLIDGVLVAAKHLINGVSIRQEEPGSIIEYFHLELASHDAVLAEGAASETYIEDGDRAMFHNAAAHRAHNPASPRFCAERLEHGARLEAIRAALDARAGVNAVITEEPDIHLLADGRIILPCAGSNGALAFDLPHTVRDLVLVSRRTTGTGSDRRGLGVAVAGITIDHRPIDLATLSDRGWHDLEHEGSRHWRWTDGAGQLPPTRRPCRITIEVAGTLRYRRFALAA